MGKDYKNKSIAKCKKGLIKEPLFLRLKDNNHNFDIKEDRAIKKKQKGKILEEKYQEELEDYLYSKQVEEEEYKNFDKE